MRQDRMPEIKTIGASGQISLGKENAGRTVLVDQVERGVWLIKTAQVIPDNELWLHTPEAKAKIDRGLAWLENHEPGETDFAQLEKRVKKHLRGRR
jgi:hypothetical protein